MIFASCLAFKKALAGLLGLPNETTQSLEVARGSEKLPIEVWLGVGWLLEELRLC